MITATEIYCLNEIGKRTNNEDAISPQKGGATLKDNLFIVCDGVGGENKGEVASEIVCTTIQQYFKSRPKIAGQEKEIIEKAIQYANEKLMEYARQDSTAKRMSTTLALALLADQSVLVAWCGDTRIHHIRNGKVIWKSKDHSLVSELVSSGEITEEEARRHPRRNVITRSLNALNSNNLVDFYEINNFETNDYLLLCSDGLLEKINEELISQILYDDNEKQKDETFLRYCNGETKDNFSMYLIKGKKVKAKKMALPLYKVLLFSFVFLLCLICIAFILKAKM